MKIFNHNLKGQTEYNKSIKYVHNNFQCNGLPATRLFLIYVEVDIYKDRKKYSEISKVIMTDLQGTMEAEAPFLSFIQALYNFLSDTCRIIIQKLKPYTSVFRLS